MKFNHILISQNNDIIYTQREIKHTKREIKIYFLQCLQMYYLYVRIT